MGFFTGIKNALLGTRNFFGYAFRRLTGRIVDAEFFEEVFDTLVASDIGAELSEKIIADLKAANAKGEFTKSEQLVPFLKARLNALFPPADISLRRAESGPTVILVVGVNGSGKTTSVAKLSKYLVGRGHKVLLAACDTFRAAAIEQLTVWSARSGVDLVKHQSGGDPAAVAFDACSKAVTQDYGVLIVDTAGRLHTQKNLMDELEKIHRVIGKKIPGGPHETLLVLDATTGQNAVRQAEMFSKAAKVTGVILSKLDGSAKGGVVVAVRRATDIPVKFIGVGEKLDDIEPFDPKAFIDALFEE
jgi:fused signal recognition particle receptor